MKEKMSQLAKKIKINEKTINYLLIFILGFLVGVAVKTEAKKRVTIGYGDYLVSEMKQGFDLTKPEMPSAPSEQPVPDGNEAREAPAPDGAATQ
ncbi:MAG: hypothetical protein A2359_01255 [Candidatus Moranbacteria bacterium RIFOXYB1_FULL_43_19]|nr:MAG: hypothetical protein A2184_01110 [Candidatus Moranbacteria bacterium RIFOXYA1_FULL_44_7]OGI27887.1 MAG: hypothetical protein A2359_01255 [Candidatus Moranbacteria bacterium RIFOXYB1_FULL_43_19]OGI34081.1 MAG: hypothetical protein A2420_02825 [Candidatus Moranbacteria bacterium RIFOXYC1_FULL_44_13]OGI38102.1 MAG: hypothetical protein A2612_03585 [Candidatus Moranbacteria bacterium RIFOXYD1_FULL_44_12]